MFEDHLCALLAAVVVVALACGMVIAFILDVNHYECAVVGIPWQVWAGIGVAVVNLTIYYLLGRFGDDVGGLLPLVVVGYFVALWFYPRVVNYVASHPVFPRGARTSAALGVMFGLLHVTVFFWGMWRQDRC